MQRDSLPSRRVEYVPPRADGVTEEYLTSTGVLHRPATDGPAVRRTDGYQAFYTNGVLHRPVELGPAVSWNGYEAYYEHGKRCANPNTGNTVDTDYGYSEK